MQKNSGKNVSDMRQRDSR